MDLGNLNPSANQLDGVLRRPSLSSLSSASGYDLSHYTAQNQPLAALPQGTQLRMSTGLNKVYLGMLNNSSNTNLVSASTVVATDVGPWVEQQKQQQSLNVHSLDNGKKELPDKLSGSSVEPVLTMTPTIASSTANDSLVGEDDVDDDDVDDDDELIPTAIVIKNIPFAIKKEQLLDVMTKLGLPLPYAFNYHFDNGVFRGLAFANFTSTDETSAVVNRLNGREIGGRKLRVEYKKMLPVQERERIEREKREKRGQLEEQHRSASNASLASLVSVTSTTAATKNLSVNGQNYMSQTERLFAQYPSAANKLPLPPAELDFNDPEVLELFSQLLTYRDDNSKLIFELAFPTTLNINQRKTLSLTCQFLNLLELFDNGLIIIRRKPGQQSIQQRQQQSASFNQAHALQMQQSNQNQSSGGGVLGGHQQIPSLVSGLNAAVSNVVSLHSSSMMNLNQIPALLGSYGGSVNNSVPHAPELLRSQSQSALQIPRTRQQTSTPIQALYSQYQTSGQPQKQVSGSGKYANFGVYNQSPASVSGSGQAQLGTPTSSSAAALLRSSNNRSYVDVRSTSNLNNSFQSASAAGSPTPQNQALLYQQPGYFLGNQVGQVSQVSQPSTPGGNKDLHNRFSQFGQHNSSSMVSLQPSSSLNDEYQLGEPLASKLSSLNLSSAYDQQKAGSGIWGYKR